MKSQYPAWELLKVERYIDIHELRDYWGILDKILDDICLTVEEEIKKEEFLGRHNEIRNYLWFIS